VSRRSRDLKIGLARGGRCLRIRCRKDLRLGRAPRFGFVPPQFVSDRGQQTLPHVLRNDEPLNPGHRLAG
jgi:hypothetical protein